jgi:hypothetical protein
MTVDLRKLADNKTQMDYKADIKIKTGWRFSATARQPHTDC